MQSVLAEKNTDPKICLPKSVTAITEALLSFHGNGYVNT